MVNVGTIDCHGKNADLCESLGHDYGTVFYQYGEVKKGEGLVGHNEFDFKILAGGSESLSHAVLEKKNWDEFEP